MKRFSGKSCCQHCNPWTGKCRLANRDTCWEGLTANKKGICPFPYVNGVAESRRCAHYSKPMTLKDAQAWESLYAWRNRYIGHVVTIANWVSLVTLVKKYFDPKG